MNRLGAAGLVAFALGVGVMLAPGVVPIPVDRLAVSLVGLAAFLPAYSLLRLRLRGGIVLTATADPEVPPSVPVPGADLREAVAAFTGGHPFGGRRGLREAAVAVLTRFAGVDEADARARIADGRWTTDRVAAAHLEDDGAGTSLHSRLRRLLGREADYVRGQRRAVAAIAAVAGLASDGDTSRAPVTATVAALARRVGERVETVEHRPASSAPATRSTGHWKGIGAVALVAAGIGVIADAPALVLSAVVGAGFAAFARGATPSSAALSVERTIDEAAPDPGDRVSVTLSVTNEGDGRLVDLRLVDGVPEALSVVAGSPRLATSIGAGESETLHYAVEARRGVHEFGPVTAVSRDLAGASETHQQVPAATTLTSIPPLRPVAARVPLRRPATASVGPAPTAEGGDGVEFHATRAYQRGDPMTRIDWNRRARTGELATLEFRAERSVTVVLVVDVRPPAFRAHHGRAPHAVDRALDAAGRVAASLLDAGHRVGLGAFGADCWLPPGAGPVHRARLRRHLATEPGFASAPSGPADVPDDTRLERRLPAGAQLLVLSPLCDARGARLVRRFDAAGHRATVLSPDPTSTDGTGPLLATVARRVRLTDLRRAGIPVVDWAPGQRLAAALAGQAREGRP